MAVITGQRTTGNIAPSQRVIDLSETVLLLEPDSAPITTILKRLYDGGLRKPAKDPKIGWHNDQLETRWDAVNAAAGYAVGITAIVVDNAALFAPEDLVSVPRTGEIMSVTSVNTGTNTLTVDRGFGSSDPAAIVDNDPLYIIGTAAEEGDTSQPIRSENPTLVNNYMEIFKTSVGETNTERSSSNESMPHDATLQRKKKGIEHLKDIEGALLFGAPAETTGADGAPRRAMGGLLYFLDQNRQDAGGTLTEAEWETWISTITRYGSKKKAVFASRKVASVLNQFPLSKVQTKVDGDTYGVSVKNYQTVHGEVSIVVHDMLEGATWGGYAIAVDFKGGNIAYRYLNGDGPGESRDTSLKTNRQEPDRDGRRDEWISECSLQVGLAKTHGVLTGVSG